MPNHVAAYDDAAPSFGCHRGLPEGAAELVRTAVLHVIEPMPRPCLLDVGAGTGRIGRAFVAAGDDYVGVDLSLGMLREFARRGAFGSIADRGSAARLVQADGCGLPFRDAAFDAVMLIQVFGGLRGWRRLMEEARRVLRPAGALVLGRIVAPEDGVDARMKRRLSAILGEMGAAPEHGNARVEVEAWLGANAAHAARVTAAAWDAERTPRGFLERHRTGARFSALPERTKDRSLRSLGEWAAREFGSLDAKLFERHEFELGIFRLGQGGR
jgi:SAM-dependent methyltransferase